MNINQTQNIESIIYSVRGLQVMLDSDLASMYQTETKYINRSVSRNLNRFPVDFAFQLNDKEWESLRFQIGTLNEKTSRGKHRKYLPWVFTEHGVTMLSAVLNTDVAVEVSIYIIKAFVSMRKFMLNNASVFQRLNQVELNQLKSNERIDKIFRALEKTNSIPKQGVFFDGQIFDAYELMSKIIRSAKKEINLIDNFIDESVLMHLSKRAANVEAIIYTRKITKQLELDLDKYNSQYAPILIRELSESHDRFIIVDRNDLYHIGASLKDLGKKWFAFSKLNEFLPEILKKLDKN
jgi:phage regulator Rha-like protein